MLAHIGTRSLQQVLAHVQLQELTYGGLKPAYQARLQSCLAGVHATDHTLMLGLARAQFALDDHASACETLDRLRAAHPDLNCPDGHLLYARSKERQGELEQALTEYAALAEYYPGEEARCRLALLLQKTGRVAEARTLFQHVVRSVDRASKLYHRSERDWYEVARRNLTG
jgi:hypothetical protein